MPSQSALSARPSGMRPAARSMPASNQAHGSAATRSERCHRSGHTFSPPAIHWKEATPTGVSTEDSPAWRERRKDGESDDDLSSRASMNAAAPASGFGETPE